MRLCSRAILLIASIVFLGFSMPSEIASLVSRAESLARQIEQLEAQKSKLEGELEELAAKIDSLKAQGSGPVGRARLERALALASEMSDNLERLELKLQEARQKRDAIGSKIASACEKRMEVAAEQVRSAKTEEEAKNALEAYLAYRNVRDTWVSQVPADAQEFLIPRPTPSDSPSDLKRKLELIDELISTLAQLRSEIQKRLEALRRELELEKEILERAELRKLFEEGEIETHGAKPTRADLERIGKEIKRIENWLNYLDRVHSELLSARGEVKKRIEETRRDMK